MDDHQKAPIGPADSEAVPVPAPVYVQVGDDASASHRNRRRARAIVSLPGVLLFGIVALVLTGLGHPVVGLVVGSALGVAISVVVSAGATSLVLRSLGARRADEDDVPRAQNLVEGLCASMGLPLPALWVVQDDARNALALGRGHRTAALVLTSGLAANLDPVALEGVLAHELTHVKRADIASATVAVAVLLPFATLVPGVGTVVHRLAGRGREFRADRLAVAVTRYPPGLRGALSDLADGPPPSPGSPLAGRAVGRATRWLWTVALPLPASTPGSVAGRVGERGREEPSGGGSEQKVGELDAAPVRIAALEEW